MITPAQPAHPAASVRDYCSGAYKIFARAQSTAYFDKIKGMIGVSDKGELKEVLSKFSLEQNASIYIPRWEMNYFSPSELVGIEKIATRP